jgi:multidrug efflux pump subunit AcrA (membrane-fusion protein)
MIIMRLSYNRIVVLFAELVRLRCARWLLMIAVVLPVEMHRCVGDDAPPTPKDASAVADATVASTVVIDSVIVTVAEEVNVPAAQAGVLASIAVKPGNIVDRGTLVATLRDDDVRLLVDRTKTNAEIAIREFNNDLNQLYATKSTDVARAELKRAMESNVKYPKTVSQTELDRLRLLVEQGELEIKRAEHERQIAGLTSQIRQNEHQTALDELALRQIVAPLQGMIVEVYQRTGQWVQPGDAVVRIIRLDRLRVEGFLPATVGKLSLVGKPASVISRQDDGRSIELPGEVVFVSPEIDPINAQVRIWIEIDNSQLQLQPGMTAAVKVSTQ